MTDAPALPPWCSVRPLAPYLRDDRELVCERCGRRQLYDSSRLREQAEAVMHQVFALQHRHEDGP